MPKGKTEVVQTDQATAAETVSDQQETTTQTTGENVGTVTAEKTFTQSELNTIIQQRLQQERQKYADYDQLRQSVASLTEERDTERGRLQQLEQQNEQLSTRSKETGIEAAITKAASKIGLDAEAAIRLADQATFTTDEAGALTNAEEVVKAVAERYPGLLRRGVPPVTAVNPQDTGASVTPEMKAARQRAEYFGGNAGAFWGQGGVRLPLDT